MMDLKDKVVLITGASSGIGEALAVGLAREGCRVLLMGRRGDVLAKLADRVRPQAADVDVFIGDVRDAGQCVAAVNQAVEKWGRLDIAVLSAGVGYYMRVHEFDVAKANETIAINVSGIINCVGAAMPVMIRQKSGMIVGLSSLAAYFVVPIAASYAASKAAVTSFLTGMQLGLMRHGVDVLIVEPGYVRTPMTAQNKRMPFLIEADDAADRIIRAIRQRKKLLRFPWAMVQLVRLVRLLPQALARRLA
jgi:short-subunit dehydrogenase